MLSFIHWCRFSSRLRVCDAWLEGAHESHCAPSCLRGNKTYPRKKRIDRHGLRLEQAQRVVATSLKLECVKNVKTKMSQTFHGTWELEAKGDFFRKPPAFHRLPFMPQFAGDIRARAGYLKWTAQIPRKAYRWPLGSGSKCCDGVSNVEAEPRERLFLMRSPRKHPSCGP